jgi:hypothetical protein
MLPIDQDIQIDVLSMKWNQGCNKKEVDMSKLHGLLISSRTTLKDVSKKLGVGTTKLHNIKREGAIERVSNSLKPFLTIKNKKGQLKWCIFMLDPRSIPHCTIPSLKVYLILSLLMKSGLTLLEKQKGIIRPR